MKIGIKYCGGCNSRYDRTKEIKKLIKQFPQHTFFYETQDAGICDVWLIVCGCMTACPITDGLVATKKMFTLRIPKDFAAVVAFLKQSGASENPHEKRTLYISETAMLSKTFTDADIAIFAKLTGDFGKLHTDPAFAATYGFGHPVVHGVLTGSLMSSIMGTLLPGAGTILMDEKLTFSAPVFSGDTITATITFMNYQDKKRYYIGEFHGTCKNQKEIIVAKGIYHQMMMKNLLTIQIKE